MLNSLRQHLKNLFWVKKPATVLKKPAIALITYSRFEYFSKVFQSISTQKINGQLMSDHFDFFVFQDGLLDNETPENIKGHNEIADFLKLNFSDSNFFSQSKNLGVAFHFDFVERFLFNTQERPWVAFFEDDLVLGQGYLETLMCMASSFKDDDRVAMFSCFGKMFNQSIEDQLENQHALVSMEHHWGFGMHQSAWRKRQALVDEYLKILIDLPYRERQHGRIQNWQAFCGLKVGPTSQDYAKACAVATTGCIKVSSYANFGTYIGEYGLHFTPDLYAKKGYANSNLFPVPINQTFKLDDATYQKLLAQQQSLTIENVSNFNQGEFRLQLINGSFAPQNSDQWQNKSTTEADVVAAYKIFLDRLPETRQVITSRVGVQPEKLLASFLVAPEFRARKQLHPIIVALAKEIIEKNKASE